MFSAENSLRPWRFIWDGPQLLHTCSTCMSIPRHYLGGVLFILYEMDLNFCTTCSTCMSIPRNYLRGVFFIFAEYIWSYVVLLGIRAYIARRRVSDHKPVGELHTSATPPPLMVLSIEWTTHLVGHDVSPLFTTDTKTWTSRGLAWQLNKSACNSGTCRTLLVHNLKQNFSERKCALQRTKKKNIISLLKNDVWILVRLS